MKSKAEPSPEFKLNLRRQILALAESQKQKSQERTPFMHKLFDTKTIWGLGTVAAVLALVIILQNNAAGPTSQANVSPKLGFGKLPSLSHESAEKATAVGYGRGAGGGGGAATDSAAPMIDRTIPSPMPVPPDNGEYLPPKVSYQLNVELPAVENELWVYRINGLTIGREVLGALGRLTNINIFSKISAANLEGFSFVVPNSPYRYSIEQYGRFNIWGNFAQSDYSPNNQMQAPPDQELIDIAENFINEHGIDRTGLGQPYVDNSWRQYYYLKADIPESDKMIWTPQQINVNYPMTFDGVKVVSFNAQDDPGLSVNVDIVNKRVAGLNGRWASHKDKSLYPASAQAIIKEQARQGGLNPVWGWVDVQFTPEQDVRRKQITVHLNTAELAYVQQYKYDQSSGTSLSYWIPVYAFTGNYVDENGNEQVYGTIVPAIQGDFFEANPIKIMGGRG